MFSNTVMCGIERVVLEHHRDVAVLRRGVVHDLAADQDLAIGDVFEPRDHAQRRALAAAGRAHQHDEFLVGDVEVDASHGGCVVVVFDDFMQGDLCHDVPPP
jgi:hypothetical protein